MTKYLISFNSRAMVVAEDEWELVGRESHAVVQQAKDAGAWVFAGGIEQSVPPVRVASDGTVTEGAYPANERLSGGFVVLELQSRDAALEWAARFAVSCRCPQEVWEFMNDPESLSRGAVAGHEEPAVATRCEKAARPVGGRAGRRGVRVRQ